MNELSQYNPDNYHISHTRSVYVQLEGTRLRLQTPRHAVPKRAMWNEPTIHHTNFIFQRFLDLSSCTVYLMPEKLVKKRLWSKKYPICIQTKTSSSIEEKVMSQSTAEGAEDAKELGYEMINHDNRDGKFYLFGRTSREKEEWYRRFTAASQGTPLPTQMVGLLNKLLESQKLKARPSSVSSENGADTSPPTSSLVHSATDSDLKATSSCNTPSLLPTSAPITSSSATNPLSTSVPAFSASTGLLPSATTSHEEQYLHYLRYMARLMPTDTLDRFFASAGPNIPRRMFYSGLSIPGTSVARCEDSVVWFNALLGRFFWDFLRESSWADIVKEKIQKKLSKIHVS